MDATATTKPPKPRQPRTRCPWCKRQLSPEGACPNKQWRCVASSHSEIYFRAKAARAVANPETENTKEMS